MASGFRPFSVVLFAVCLMTVLFGCGGDAPNDKPNSGLVSGKVTLDGSPLANALITFSPDSHRDSTGTTDAEGKYTLTFGANQGAEVGTHFVRIVSKTPGARQHDAKGEVVPDNTPEKVPAKYNTETTLTFTVKSGDNPNTNFDLTSK